MEKNTFLLLVLTLIDVSQSRDLWYPDLPEISNITLQKGQPIRLDKAYQKLQLCGLKGTIFSDTLSQLYNITELRICRSTIEKIEPGALCASQEIKTLELDFYGISNPPLLTKEMFENCTNIEELLLKFDSRNNTVGDALLENLPNLKNVTLQGYTVNHLTKDFLKIPRDSSLKKLIIASANIREIDGDAFTNLKNLEELGIIRNRELTTVPENLFQNTKKLRILQLSYNGIRDLSWDEFKGLSDLEELSLFQNQIASFDDVKIAGNLPKLKRLYVELNPPPCKQTEAFVNRLKSKMTHAIQVTYKFDPGYYDSCEDEDTE